ncbi:hypothetical protein VUR80DRAFT_662 [Thermomyces stellatus]
MPPAPARRPSSRRSSRDRLYVGDCWAPPPASHTSLFARTLTAVARSPVIAISDGQVGNTRAPLFYCGCSQPMSGPRHNAPVTHPPGNCHSIGSARFRHRCAGPDNGAAVTDPPLATVSWAPLTELCPPVQAGGVSGDVYIDVTSYPILKDFLGHAERCATALDLEHS